CRVSRRSRRRRTNQRPTRQSESGERISYKHLEAVDSNDSARIAAPSLVLHFKISPVLFDQSRRSSSSKLILISSANFLIRSSTARYFFFVPGGSGDSITPSSFRVCKMCLSRIAYPK